MSYPLVGQSVTLTAATNADVGPTPYFITIYNETTGAQLAACGHGTECTATVAQDTPGTQDYEAFVGDDAAGAGQPGFVLVPSNEVLVTWWRFISHGPPGSLASGLQGCAAFTSGGRLDMCGMQPRKTLIA